MFSAVVERRVLALDWNAREIRMVQARLRKRRLVEIEILRTWFIDAEQDAGDPDALAREIRKAIDTEDSVDPLGIQAKHVLVSLPRDQVVLNTLHLPRVEPGQTAAMVEYQIGKLLPFPVSEAAVDFALPPHTHPDEGETLPVLVGAARKEVPGFYQEVCEKAGLKLERIGLRPAANAMAVNELLKESRPERVLFVDVGPTQTEIDVIVRGRLAFSRAAGVRIPKTILGTATIPFPGGQDAVEETVDRWSDSDDLSTESGESPFSSTALVNAVLVEVTRTIEAYRNTEPGVKMDHVVIGGCTGLEEALAEAIQKRFGTSTETFNPALVFGLEGARHESAGAFGAALGLILDHGVDPERHFDFLNPKKQVSDAQVRLRKLPRPAIYVPLLLGAMILSWFMVTRPQRQALAQANQDIVTLEEQLAETKDLNTVVKSIEEFEAARVIWVEPFKQLLAVFPGHKDVVIDKVDMSGDDARMDLLIRCKERALPETIRRALLETRPGDAAKPYFNVDLSRQGESGAEPYTHDVKVTVDLLSRKSAEKKPAAG